MEVINSQSESKVDNERKFNSWMEWLNEKITLVNERTVRMTIRNVNKIDTT
jgi:Fe-S cluster biosynthesis and repair protein YggX